jgi:hypothetical protein
MNIGCPFRIVHPSRVMPGRDTHPRLSDTGIEEGLSGSTPDPEGTVNET